MLLSLVRLNMFGCVWAFSGWSLEWHQMRFERRFGGTRGCHCSTHRGTWRNVVKNLEKRATRDVGVLGCKNAGCPRWWCGRLLPRSGTRSGPDWSRLHCNQPAKYVENICAYCIILCIWSTGLLACYSITACFVLMCCPNVVCLFETHVQLWCLGIYCLMVSSENNHFMTLELIVVRRINCTGFDTARSFRGTLLLNHWTLYRSLPSRVETSLCAMQLGLHFMMSKILLDCRISTWNFQHLKDDTW